MLGDALTPREANDVSVLLAQMISLFFDSLPRRDQKKWARVYLNGLVSTSGKKTVRSIAGGEAGAGSVEQSLQQFISKSPWDWTPVRRTLAQHLESRVQRPLTWVVRSMVIEKAGDRSVGVGRQYVPQLGRMANCQQATGIWLASSEVSFPVEWTLSLPAPWTSELHRRQARIPETARSRTPVQDAIHAVVSMAENWQLERRPVVMEVGTADLPHVVTQFTAHDIPFVLKVDGSLPVALATAGRRRTARTTSAREVMDALRAQRRLVRWPRHDRPEEAVTPLVAAAVHASLAEEGEAGGVPPLVLLGAWTEAADQLPSEFWITNLPDVPLGRLFLLAKLTDRVTLDFNDICETVGIRDFEGRSFRGWHHHATLVSVAHAARLLSTRAHGYAPAPPPRADRVPALSLASPLPFPPAGQREFIR